MRTPSHVLSLILGALVTTATLPTSLFAASQEEERSNLKKLLVNSEWSQSNGGSNGRPLGVIDFREYGKCTSSGWFATQDHAPLFYIVEASNVVKLYHKDPKSVSKAPYWYMKVNIEETTAENDPSSGTLSGSLYLRYKGPIKRN